MSLKTFDVAIVGGGPAGTTCASLLLKYNPRLEVVLIEREKFPRDHVGESQLPVIGKVLDEMGCWTKVEAAGFPVKIGATYRWGRTNELWDFEFVPDGKFTGGKRPGQYVGQRRQTAFQVDRAIYDKILLDHAISLDCEVRQPKAVRKVVAERDRIESLVLEDGEEIRAKWYVDASGHTGVLRRAMGVEIDAPTSLQNIAIWDYWQNADWAVNIGVGGTRVQVISIGFGWIWFIPLGPTRTSVGLTVPAAYYKECGKRPELLYQEALAAAPIISRLMEKATCENKLSTTKDWSFVAKRLAGENWFLAGESAGFADPILAAGMTLAHMGARDVAYAILAAERRDYEIEWLRDWYDRSNRQKIGQHIRFADFWYSANSCFADLKDHTKAIAKDAGLELTSDEAWQWLGTGGFVDADELGAGLGGFNVGAVRALADKFVDLPETSVLAGTNTYRLNLEGAEKGWGARLEGGRINRHRTYCRNGKSLPNAGTFRTVIAATKELINFDSLLDTLRIQAENNGMSQRQLDELVQQAFVALEGMVEDGWVEASCDPSIEPLVVPTDRAALIHANRD